MSRCLHTEEYRKKEDPSLDLGFNTYGTARMLHDDFDGTMSKLRELGYTSVEPMIFSTAPFLASVPCPNGRCCAFGSWTAESGLRRSMLQSVSQQCAL